MSNVFCASNYDNAERFNVYQTQARLTETINPTSILELSTGSGFMKRYWQSKEINVFSIDINKELKPDLIQDIAVPFELNNRFDLVACFQVLEHIEENKLWKVFANIKAHSNKAIFSIPIQTWFIKGIFKCPLIRKDLEFCFYREKRKDCVPYRKWMLGDNKHSVKWFEDLLKQNKFKTVKTSVPATDPLHAYFVCEA